MPDLLTPAELAAIAEREEKATPPVVYFINSPDTGFDEYPTLKEALDAAEETISNYRDEAIDGWNEEVTSIRVGIITHDVEQFDVKHRKDCGEDENWACPNCDEMCDYRMSSDGDLLALLNVARADRAALLRHIAALEARAPAPADDMEALLADAERDAASDEADWAFETPLAKLLRRLATALRETLAREQYAENVMRDTQEELDMHRAYVGDLIKERDAERARAEKAEHNECCLRAALEELGYTGTVPEGVWDALTQRAEKAEAELADLTQTTGELCPECHWRGVRDDGCEFCKAHRLEADLAAARKELAGLEGGAQ